MKRIIIFASFLFVAAVISASLPGCDTLITEIINTERFDSTLGQQCITCHTDANDALIVIPEGQLKNSAHFSIEHLEETVNLNGTDFNTAMCGPVCHSGNGFVDFIASGDEIPQSQPSTINCYTCHTPHTGNLEDFNLRTLRGSDTLGIILNSGERYNLGKSNMCVHCHQATPLPDSTPSITLLADFGPHNSSQANVLIGAGGFGVDTADVTPSHRRTRITEGCLNCHFGVSTNGNNGIGYSFGEHTFRLENESTGEEFIDNCNVAGCHGTLGTPIITSLFDSPILSTIDTLSDSLQSLLISLNILDSTDTNGTRFMAGIDVPTNSALMLHNYLLHKLDGSKGVHNAAFIDSLLRASIAMYDSIPQPQFAAVSSTTICRGDILIFGDLSINEISWIWDFGDGVSDTAMLPDQPQGSHQYDSAGIFTVTLTITGPGDQVATISKANYVTVIDSVVAAMNISETAGIDTLRVNFTDVSTGGVTFWTWDFGDASPVSNLQNPEHLYTNIGDYTVSLITGNSCFTDTLIIPDAVIVSSGSGSASLGGSSRLFRR